ncbi:MAG: ribosome silencing factor [Cryomorphaceae bacterium]|nr:MAG: ribosome silencing factor [Cryomorphaceae bacterium]
MAGKTTKKEKEALLNTIIHGLQEVKGKDIVVLDLEKIPNAVCSKFIICHGDSNVQVESLAESVEKETREQLNERPIHREGMANAEWIILDYFNIVVHIFQRSSREFYDLERLWADAPSHQVDYQI